MALRGRFGAMEGRDGRFVTENQSYSLTDTVFVVVHIMCMETRDARGYANQLHYSRECHSTVL